MKGELQSPRAVQRATSGVAIPKRVKYALLIGLIIVGCLVSFQWWKSREGSRQDSTSDPALIDMANQDAQHANSDLAVVPSEENVEVHEPTGPRPPVAPKAVETASRSATAQTPRAEPTPYTRQLVTSLAELDFSHGPLTAEQSAQWKQRLQQLVQQGSAAVPAIREFLELNRDVDFGSVNELGYPSFRTALLDALQQIGGPEVQGLMLDTLKITSVPGEIARLAKALEQQSPGQFRGEITQAAREVLAQAASDEMHGWDLGPVFQMLQTYGDPTAVADLEKSASKWSYYSALTLAALPDGQGIPSLIRLAQEPLGSPSRNAALEALAQVAFQYEEASAALVAASRSSKISDQTWIGIARLLGGDQQFIRDTGGNDAYVPVGSGVRAFHLEASNQNFYSMPGTSDMTDEQLKARISLVDQLLLGRLSEPALQGLQKARGELLAKLK